MKPLYANCHMVVSKDGEFTQIISFYYYDEDLEWWPIHRKPEEYNRWINILYENMQKFLDEEVILINFRRVKAKVVYVNIEHIAKEIPVVTYVIKFRGRFQRGLNVYENIFEPCKAEYNFTILWCLPQGSRVLEVVASGDYDVVGENIFIWVYRGERVIGFEKIVFHLP